MAKRSIVRYAVVGLGHIAQVAVLPAFKNARRNSQLTALVTDDSAKARQLAIPRIRTDKKPTKEQIIRRPAIRKTKLVNVRSATVD